MPSKEPRHGPPPLTRRRGLRVAFLLGSVVPILFSHSYYTLGAECPTAPHDHIIANPSRPTVADPADITELGVLELEYGWERDWFPGGVRGDNFGALLKFAVACNLEIRWFFNPLIGLGGQRGFGDNWVGMQYRFRRQTSRVPTLAASYMVKIPSANAGKGLGSGRVDHQFKFLASKDVRGLHFDFNASALLIGRPDARGYDHNSEINLAFARALRGKLAVTGEVYGDTRLNRLFPAFASTLVALTYTITPRLVVDAGIDVAVTRDAPFHKRFVAGFVYSLAELYPQIRRQLKGD